MTDINLILEWVGVIFAIFGSIFMANKAKPFFSWSLWIFSNIVNIFLFTRTNQYGFLLMNIGGFIINSFGLYQWSKHKENIDYLVMKVLLFCSQVFCFLGTLFLVFFIISPEVKYAEWFGSMFGLMASFLLASRHKYSYLCWFIWTFSNLTLLIVTYMTNQYGIMFLQIVFMFINLFACYKIIYKNNNLVVNQ